MEKTGLKIETKFVADEDGRIRISENRGTRKFPPDDRFFFFQTMTVFTTGTGSFAIRTSRRMASGLMIYFLGNKDFQSRVLRENEANAKSYLYTPVSEPKAALTTHPLFPDQS